MENNTTKFIKIGDKIIFKNSTDGLDYNLESNKVYTIVVDSYTDEISFKTSPNLSLPNKIYTTEKEDKLINKILTQYEKQENGVMGVMLEGLKGSGKTITAKVIANKSNLPIILIDKTFNPRMFKNLFNKLSETEVCFIFDEVDKLNSENSRYYDDSFLLTVLDGANTSGKKLILFTCNDVDKINNCMIDRCSRIRYWSTFKELSASMIQNILQDRLNDKDNIKKLTDFIQKKFKYITFDNIIAFIDEVNSYPDESLDVLFDDMNLSKR